MPLTRISDSLIVYTEPDSDSIVVFGENSNGAFQLKTPVRSPLGQREGVAGFLLTPDEQWIIRGGSSVIDSTPAHSPVPLDLDLACRDGLVLSTTVSDYGLLVREWESQKVLHTLKGRHKG